MAMNDAVRFVAGDLHRETLTEDDVDSIRTAIEHNGVVVTSIQLPIWGQVYCVGGIHPVLSCLQAPVDDDWLTQNYENLLIRLRGSPVQEHNCRIRNWLSNIDIKFSDVYSNHNASVCHR